MGLLEFFRLRLHRLPQFIIRMLLFYFFDVFAKGHFNGRSHLLRAEGFVKVPQGFDLLCPFQALFISMNGNKYHGDI